MLLLLMTEHYKVPGWQGLKHDDVPARSHQNHSLSVYDIYICNC